jgi:hypothetical protein
MASKSVARRIEKVSALIEEQALTKEQLFRLPAPDHGNSCAGKQYRQITR